MVPFQDWANLASPEPTFSSILKYNDARLTVFPDIDLNQVTAEQVMQFLEESFQDMWGRLFFSIESNALLKLFGL